MAFMTDTLLNAKTGRHELHFVNQQYDYLMGIRWNAALNDYAFDVDFAEAREIARTWGRAKFEPEETLAVARKELRERDAAKR